MFRSCVGLGMVPEDLPAVKWIPSDIAASVTLKQTFVDVNHRSTKGNGTLEYYHLENPTSTPWSVIAGTLSQYKGRNLALVPFEQWLSKVRELGVEDAERVPAIRLLAWYESNDPIVPALDVKNTLAIAPELDYGALTPGLLEKYLNTKECEYSLEQLKVGHSIGMVRHLFKGHAFITQLILSTIHLSAVLENQVSLYDSVLN